MNQRTIKTCKGCKETMVTVAEHEIYCTACQEDMDRICKSADISDEVKKYIIQNYPKYMDWLVKQNEKPEYAANYHTFQDTTETFYISRACDDKKPF